MNLPAIFSFTSAGVAFAFLLLIPFVKRHSIPMWLFMAGMAMLGGEQILTGFTLLVDHHRELPQLFFYRFLFTMLLPGLWLAFAATYSRADPLSALKDRASILIPALIVPIALVLWAPLHLATVEQREVTDLHWTVGLGWSGFLLQISLMLAMVGALVGLERTFRASVGTLRWKIKFMLYGMGTLFAARFFTSSQIVLLQEIDPSLETVNAVALLVCCILAGRSVLRSGSFEIDLYPSRSIISGSLVITLAGAYLIIVGLFSKLIAKFGGGQAFAIQTFVILVALVGGAILLQSDRARQAVRRFVTRNFQRPLFDFRTLWLRVTDATSQSVRQEDICLSTTKLLANLFDTKLTNIWIHDVATNQFRLVAATDRKASDTESPAIPSGDIPRALLEVPDPQDLDRLDFEWAKAIADANQSSFDDGGNRVIVPLTGQGNAVGFIVLGDRTNTLRFTQQEFDTLSCIGAHLSGSLLSAALTRRLEESKEVEAFQTMATFFVHDLKNAVSTLNLMLKNMPKHWDNPEFREDALRGIGNTSNRITDLITRLGEVRSELELDRQRTTAQEIVEKALAQWEVPSHVSFTQSITDVPCPMRADLPKLISVLLNLLINASEAMDSEGKLDLTLTSEAKHAYFVVTDSGSGMSDAFIRDSLFRPFKTTKKSGLGIGMFQSKMVVEAHNGSISVDSVEGQGSVFTIRIPLAE